MVSRIPPPEDDGTNRQPRSAGVLALLLVFAVVVGLWLFTGQGQDEGDDTSVATDTSAPSEPSASLDLSVESGPPSDEPSGSSEKSGQPGARDVDPDSGLANVYLLDLPPEAADTVEVIDLGPPYPYDQDGGTFGNYEGLLPDHERGYYQEFTVETPGSYDRGARRVVEGAEGELYWTDDHYESFSRIVL